MILVAGGDSFIFGNELADQTTGPSLSTFPALLAGQSSMDYKCVAWPGNANNAITRMVLNECEQSLNQGQKVAVMIMWTFINRYEFKFTFDTKQALSPWYSINSWNVEDHEKILSKLLNADDKMISHHLANQRTAEATGISAFARNYFKYVGYNEYHALYLTLKEILLLQNYLNIKNIPYIFVTADNSFYQHSIYERIKDDYMANIYNQIDWNSWYFFPEGKNSNETQAPRGFYQWALENKYKVGATHPLEDAHIDAAELIKEKFNELVKKHY